MKLKLLDDPQEKAGLTLVKRLKKEGYQAFWVGGCVRNKIMNLPAKDIDIATNAAPEQVIRLFPKTIAVGAKFGVVIVLQDDVRIEVATFRSDGQYLDKRHPREVHFSDARQDALRRDFTINSLFWDPTTGEILDFVEGRKDIERGILRCIGNPSERFQEDALRLLRAIRFAVRFSFVIEQDTWSALLEHSPQISSISPDRIREELIRIITGPHRGAALELLEQSGLLREILPEVQGLKGVPQPEEFHPEGDCFKHTQLAMELLRNPSPTLAVGCLLHDIGKPPTYEETDRIRFNAHTKVGEKMAEAICRKLRFSNTDRKAVTDLVVRHMHFLSVKEMKTSTLKRFLSHPNIEEDLELHRADCLASHGDLSNYHFCRKKLNEFRMEKEKIIPPPLVTGNDLIEQGYTPGPLFKKILERVQEAQLDGEIETKEEAIALVRFEFPL